MCEKLLGISVLGLDVWKVKKVKQLMTFYSSVSLLILLYSLYIHISMFQTIK